MERKEINNQESIRVLPIQEENASKAKWLVEILELKGIQASVDDRPILVGKRIMRARREKVKYVVLIDSEFQEHGMIKVIDCSLDKEYSRMAFQFFEQEALN